jgi:hypothetical protein
MTGGCAAVCWLVLKIPLATGIDAIVESMNEGMLSGMIGVGSDSHSYPFAGNWKWLLTKSLAAGEQVHPGVINTSYNWCIGAVSCPGDGIMNRW